MRFRAQRRITKGEGFTLVELLVVVLVIGILAAIAIPSFMNQKGKAVDAPAKELARTAQTAAATLATENNGSFLKVSPAELNRVEPSIPIAAGKNNAYLSVAASLGGGTGFEVTATASAGAGTFTIKDENGVVTRTCTGKSGGCPASGEW